MDIYENVLIGNFLFALGAAMGAKAKGNRTPPLSVNLLQQTPLDQNVGDVMLRGARVLRLIEFKRDANDSVKERNKLEQLRSGLQQPINADLVPISHEVHWFVKSFNEPFEVAICPYLDMERLAKSDSTADALSHFIDGMVSDAMREGDELDERYSHYLQLVSFCNGKESGSSGGLIVSIDADGKLNYAVIENLNELSLELARYQELFEQRLSEQVLELSQQRQLQRSGPSMER